MRDSWTGAKSSDDPTIAAQNQDNVGSWLRTDSRGKVKFMKLSVERSLRKYEHAMKLDDTSGLLPYSNLYGGERGVGSPDILMNQTLIKE